eukprot:COSAG05_NODE_2588_length_2868_cov_8.486096_5_plen_77_part_00
MHAPQVLSSNSFDGFLEQFEAASPGLVAASFLCMCLYAVLSLSHLSYRVPPPSSSEAADGVGGRSIIGVGLCGTPA